MTSFGAIYIGVLELKCEWKIMKFNSPFVLPFIWILFTVSACGTADPPEVSTDFTTSGIKADYEVNILDNTIQLTARFSHDNDSLNLDEGDSVYVIADGVEYPLTQSEEFLYIHSSVFASLPDTFNFILARDTQESADLTIIPAPLAFGFDNIIDGEVLTPVNGVITVSWSPASGDSDRFYLEYHLSCRAQSGSPSIDRTYKVGVVDDGEHAIDLNAILNNEDLDYCSDLDITGSRERFGSLDSAFRSGSTTGRQIVTVSNLEILSL